MIAAPLLFVAGAATSPPQEDGSAASYIDSLGNDPFLTALSANLFHYSWVLFAFAALAAIGLVRGSRGRTLTLVGGLAAAFGSIQFTGLLYSDWVLEALDNQLSMGQAVDIFEHVNGAASISIWLLTRQAVRRARLPAALRRPGPRRGDHVVAGAVVAAPDGRLRCPGRCRRHRPRPRLLRAELPGRRPPRPARSSGSRSSLTGPPRGGFWLLLRHREGRNGWAGQPFLPSRLVPANQTSPRRRD